MSAQVDSAVDHDLGDRTPVPGEAEPQPRPVQHLEVYD